jgi:hypothetical protein
MKFLKNILLALLFIATPAVADDVSPSHTYVDGEILTAALLNTSLDEIRNEVNDLDGANLASNIAITTSGTFTLTGTLSATGTSNTIGNGGSDALTLNLPGNITLSNAMTVSGTWADLGIITTADINGGTIDGTTIGASSATTGKFTTIHTSGNVGINTTAAISYLQVRPAADKNIIVQSNVLLSDGAAISSVNDANGANRGLELRGSTVQLSALSSNPIQFYTNGSQRAMISSSGNVGIGSTNPGVALDVQGTIRVTGYSGPGQDQLFTSSGTFVAPSGVTKIYLTMIGQGGNGGTGFSGGAAVGGGGGGAGQYIYNMPYTVVPGNSYTITINSTSTTFDSVSVVAGSAGSAGGAASGGTGGAGGVSVPGTGGNASGATGGTAGAQTKFAGATGGNGAQTGGGAGAGSIFGPGGAGADDGNVGTAAPSTSYGAGGGGGAGGNPTGRAGGAGAAGAVLIMF